MNIKPAKNLSVAPTYGHYQSQIQRPANGQFPRKQRNVCGLKIMSLTVIVYNTGCSSLIEELDVKVSACQ